MARRRSALVLTAAVLAATVLATATGASGASSRKANFKSSVFATGARIFHATARGREAIAQPDDITSLGGDIYVGFQNGVGPQGQASPTGNRDSTVVEFDLSGRPVAQWDLVGKCDGLTADPITGQIIATIDEDAHSSLYLIAPGGAAVHYRYARPLPSHGGTDAISVYRGLVLISASAPGTTGAAAPRARYPAVYRAVFNTGTHVVTLRSLFGDEARARVANTNSPQHGRTVRLALTDPDSNEHVPSYARRFAGDFMLTSQGDEEQIFVSHAGARGQSLAVLKLTSSVDDTAWPSSSAGALYTTDNSNDTVYRVTGAFKRGSVWVAVTPCDENGAPSTCPGPGFPANYLGELNPDTGAITRVAVKGPAVEPQGMLFLAPAG